MLEAVRREGEPLSGPVIAVLSVAAGTVALTIT
jgi:hypothetical protein